MASGDHGKATSPGTPQSSTCRGHGQWLGKDWGLLLQVMVGSPRGTCSSTVSTLPPLHQALWHRGIQGTCCGIGPDSKQLLETCAGANTFRVLYITLQAAP